MQTIPEEILSHIFSLVGNNLALYNTFHKYRHILTKSCKVPKTNIELERELKVGNWACIYKLDEKLDINFALRGACESINTDNESMMDVVIDDIILYCLNIYIYIYIYILLNESVYMTHKRNQRS